MRGRRRLFVCKPLLQISQRNHGLLSESNGHWQGWHRMLVVVGTEW